MPSSSTIHCRRAAVLLRRAGPGDAVSADAMGQCLALRAQGIEAQLFAHDGELRGENVQPAANLPRYANHTKDLIIYHYSIAWEEGLALIDQTSGTKILKYHNVTPPEFFEPYERNYARLCRLGRGQLHDVVRRPWFRWIGDSRYNVTDLLAAGAPEERCRIAPPFVPVAPRRRLAKDRARARRQALAAPQGRTILNVGRLVPNKGHALLLRSFAYYVHAVRSRGEAPPRLILAGSMDPNLSRYYDELRRISVHNGIEALVTFTGWISDEELRACYEVADLLSITSEHEGFCVPIVEAMRRGLPVLVLERGAVGETTGDAGIVLGEDDAAQFGAAMDRLLNNADMMTELARRGRRRFRGHFSMPAAKRAFFEALR